MVCRDPAAYPPFDRTVDLRRHSSVPEFRAFDYEPVHVAYHRQDRTVDPQIRSLECCAYEFRFRGEPCGNISPLPSTHEQDTFCSGYESIAEIAQQQRSPTTEMETPP